MCHLLEGTPTPVPSLLEPLLPFFPVPLFLFNVEVLSNCWLDLWLSGNGIFRKKKKASYWRINSFLCPCILVAFSPTHALTQYLVSCLYRVMEHSNSNRMTTQNIGIVFGPTLMRPQSDCANMAINMVYQNQAVELILSEYNQIFGSDPSRSLWHQCGTGTAAEPAHCEPEESEMHGRGAKYGPCNCSLNCSDATNSILVHDGWMNGWMEVLEQQSANWPLVAQSHTKNMCFQIESRGLFYVH